MINVELNCFKNNIVVGTNNVINSNFIDVRFPFDLLKYKENIKFLKYFNLRGEMFQKNIIVCNDGNIINSTRIDDYIIFEFETEEEAFYFKMKYT